MVIGDKTDGLKGEETKGVSQAFTDGWCGLAKLMSVVGVRSKVDEGLRRIITVPMNTRYWKE